MNMAGTEARMGMTRLGMLAWSILAVVVIGLAADESLGQSSGSGSYTLSNGVTVNWSYQIGVYNGCWRLVMRRRCGLQLIEGPEGELEAIETEEQEVESSPVEFRVIDYARALMGGALPADMVRAMTEGTGIKLSTRQDFVNEAIGAYGIHLQEHPEDWIAVREMAVALIEGNRVEDGIQMMHEAYSKKPEMGILPIKPGLLGESGERMRKMVVRVVQHTHREPTAYGWLTVAVLMQSEGRTELGGQMLDRAEELGLDGKVLDGLRVAMPSEEN